MGLPEILVSDNATIFHSAEFHRFCHKRGICQRFIPPGHPATNGQVERYCQTIKRKLKCMATNQKSLTENLQDLLFRYRATPLADGATSRKDVWSENSHST
ncbi:unnamed protein product [Nesidiocoris tenuis]|uniref:Uncharacterized protein n=2 Tax=Nesidiocoris tenuis TaxID=355587 RepID=A0ABN7BAF2_9HEMI|nr:Hypothetical protein NTJ_13439 [Nesidiocoris tenuis]CAA9993723.1 unnamed protein product [Nesidiocoris tenuis]